MCGIAGSVNWGDEACVRRMLALTAHRGPDDSGTWQHAAPDGTRTLLGSVRLAILDLSPAGHMPMVSDDGRVALAYNGEVYNFPQLRTELAARGHVFKSGTDTEVVLHMYLEYGVECLGKLNGMFALALCDLRSGRPRLLLARDQLGIKPLYYTQRGSKLGFASEVKALLCLPEMRAEMDTKALHQYLTFLWVPDPKTLFEGVRKLEAGHFALFERGQLSIHRYWDLEFPPAGAEPPAREEELCEELREIFGRAVRRQMISDVPLGAFLSAGLDSSSIVAEMAAASHDPVRTYTVTFPERYRIGESRLDDPAVAARLAAGLGCDHHQIEVDPKVTELLPKLVWHSDEPLADPAIITAYLVCKHARDQVTVLLSGVGGDELFAGYRKHTAAMWAGAYRRLPGLLRRGIIEPAAKVLPSMRGTRLMGPVRLLQKMVRSGSLPPLDGFLMNSTYLDHNQKQELYLPALAESLSGQDPWQRHREHLARVSHAGLLHQMLYLDTKAFMVSLNLTYNDKMSMASSLEVRVPFLDLELVEWAARRVPQGLKLAGGMVRPVTKHILRKAMAPMLPPEVLRQPKAGFFAPVSHWLANDLGEMTADLLSESRIKDRGLFKPQAVQRMLSEHHSGRRDWAMQIWTLLTLELWQQVFMDHGGIEPGGPA